MGAHAHHTIWLSLIKSYATCFRKSKNDPTKLFVENYIFVRESDTVIREGLILALVAHNTTQSIMRFCSTGFLQAEWFTQLLMENGLMQFLSDLDKMNTMREGVTYRSHIRF